MADFPPERQYRASSTTCAPGRWPNWDYELETFAQTRKISLVLPSLYSELEGAALARYPGRTGPSVKYLHRIIIGLDRADAAQYAQCANGSFRVLPQDHVVIWNGTARGCWTWGGPLEALGLAPARVGPRARMSGSLHSATWIACARQRR